MLDDPTCPDRSSARSSSLPEPAVLTIFAIFFIESAVLGNWIPRIPDIKANLLLNNATLGLCLLSIPFGTLCGLSVAGRLIEQTSLRTALRWAMPVWAGMFLLPAFASNLWLLAFILFFCGIAAGFVEVAMNTEADRIESASGRRIMSRCHGFWSLGSMVGALAGGALAQAGLSVQWHFLLVMPALAMIGWWAATQLPQLDETITATAANDTADAPLFRLPSRSILALCVMPLGIMAVEGAFIDWSAVFMSSVLDAPPLVLSIVYAFFSVIMAVVRLYGDPLATRYGDLLVVRVSAVAATLGIAVFALAPSLTIAIIGAALSGMGVAVVYPLAISAAAKRPGRSSADNVAAITMVSFSAFFFAPPLIGFLSEAINLRVALLALVPFTLTTLWLSGEVVKGR